jgi:hypothetical protein
MTQPFYRGQYGEIVTEARTGWNASEKIVIPASEA